MTKEKVVNYSPELESQMSEIYLAAESESERVEAVEEIQEISGKSLASIRSKLSHMQIWIPKVKPESKAKKSSKSDLVAQIADNAENPNDSFFESIAGSNRAVLSYVLGLQAVALQAEIDAFEESEDFESAESA